MPRSVLRQISHAFRQFYNNRQNNNYILKHNYFSDRNVSDISTKSDGKFKMWRVTFVV
ncbi:hypothetical protein Plhal304r1_c001g0001521 [Plasmopara halstedii]